jgi:hypothetical protein
MKKLIFLNLIFLLASCKLTTFYQVYKTNAENGIIVNNQIVFEDENCTVYYNLWSEGGDVCFNVFNKTDHDISVDLTKSFFVLNGVAFEYYQNRTTLKSSSSISSVTTYNNPYSWKSTKVSGTNTSTSSTSNTEKPELTIPSKTRVNFYEYHVINSRFIHCDLLKYPTGSNVKSVSFDKSNSPFVFYNIITYKSNNDTSRIEHRFYVNEIANFTEKIMFTKIDTSMCGRELDIPLKVFKNATPDRFYLKYSDER